MVDEQVAKPGFIRRPRSKAAKMFICGKADIRNPLRYLLMNAVASRPVSGSFQLPLT